MFKLLCQNIKVYLNNTLLQEDKDSIKSDRSDRSNASTSSKASNKSSSSSASITSGKSQTSVKSGGSESTSTFKPAAKPAKPIEENSFYHMQTALAMECSRNADLEIVIKNSKGSVCVLRNLEHLFCFYVDFRFLLLFQKK